MIKVIYIMYKFSKKNLLKILEKFDSCHIIFFLLDYDRLNNMKYRLNLFMKYFKP